MPVLLFRYTSRYPWYLPFIPLHSPTIVSIFFHTHSIAGCRSFTPDLSIDTTSGHNGSPCLSSYRHSASEIQPEETEIKRCNGQRGQRCRFSSQPDHCLACCSAGRRPSHQACSLLRAILLQWSLGLGLFQEAATRKQTLFSSSIRRHLHPL